MTKLFRSRSSPQSNSVLSSLCRGQQLVLNYYFHSRMSPVLQVSQSHSGPPALLREQRCWGGTAKSTETLQQSPSRLYALKVLSSSYWQSWAWNLYCQMYQPLNKKEIYGKQSWKWRFWGKAGIFQVQLKYFSFLNGWASTHQKSPSVKLIKTVPANLS